MLCYTLRFSFLYRRHEMTEHIKQSSCYIRALVFISGALASKADR